MAPLTGEVASDDFRADAEWAEADDDGDSVDSNDAGDGDNGFLVADTQLYKRLCPSVRPSVRPSVGPSGVIELKSGKTRISAPAHPSATGIGCVSGLVYAFKDRAESTESPQVVMLTSNCGHFLTN